MIDTAVNMRRCWLDLALTYTFGLIPHLTSNQPERLQLFVALNMKEQMEGHSDPFRR